MAKKKLLTTDACEQRLRLWERELKRRYSDANKATPFGKPVQVVLNGDDIWNLGGLFDTVRQRLAFYRLSGGGVPVEGPLLGGEPEGGEGPS